MGKLFLFAGQSLEGLREAGGSSVGYADSGEPLCLPALFHVSPCPALPPLELWPCLAPVCRHL